jgi:hypothetical protein
MLNLILILILVSIAFEILFNFLYPKDPNKYTVVDYMNMLNRDKTRNMVGRIYNPFKNFNNYE